MKREVPQKYQQKFLCNRQTSFANHGDFRSVSLAITWKEVNGLVTRRRVTDLINNWGSPSR
ncbi:hypothetical protein OUZ56_007866 [Daphnia magna]|uniref:Uncharacterized protein n=1 Tax=Daphnia magna TaxID=35525 RepID=A0ABR0ABA0_9CRUS|nr:hypothetical protein OUZ56_007866 [Daphnia magna]